MSNLAIVRSRGLIRICVAAVCIASTITFTAIEQASASPTSELIAAPDADKLLASMNGDSRPCPTLVSQGSVGRDIASALSASTDSPIVPTVGLKSPEEVADAVQQIGCDNAVLIGSSDDILDDDFTRGLEASGIRIDEKIDTSNPKDAWIRSAQIDLPSSDRLILADAESATDTAFARTYAAQAAARYLPWNSDDDAGPLRDFLEGNPRATLTFVGALDAFPFDQLDESLSSRIATVDTSDATAAQLTAAREWQLDGSNLRKVFVAAADQPEALSLAGRLARERRGIAISGGPSGSIADGAALAFMSLLSPDRSSATLVGWGHTSADATALGSRFTTEFGTGLFRLTGLQSATDGYTLEFRAIAGITKYEIYGFDGSLTAASSSPNMKLSDISEAAVAIARAGSREAYRVELRFNDLADGALGTTAVGLSMLADINVLRFTGSRTIPRLVTRIESDPYDENSVPISKTLGITCSPEWADPRINRRHEYSYQVSELSNIGTSTCESGSAKAATGEALGESRIDSPATMLPNGRQAFSGHRPSLSRADAALASAVGDGRSRAAGDDWPDFLVRWNAYIPDSKVPFPALTGSPGRPFVAFHGDGHGINQSNSSVRFRQDLRFKFGSNRKVTYSEHMGESIRYACARPLSNCVVTGRATASLSQLNGGGGHTSNTTANAFLDAQASLPLVSLAPAIDTRVLVSVRPGNSSIRAYHDRMPQHEVYTGVPQSEWIRAYSSPYSGWFQLACLSSSFTNQIPGCAVNANIRL